MLRALKNKDQLAKLKEAVKPYLFAWCDWTKDEACELDKQEIEMMNALIATNFKLSFLECLIGHCHSDSFESTLKKLHSGEETFKERMIFKFLYDAIELAGRTGRKNALDQHIDTLQLPVEIVLLFKKLRIRCIRDFGRLYNEDDFKTKRIFDLIIRFYQIR